MVLCPRGDFFPPLNHSHWTLRSCVCSMVTLLCPHWLEVLKCQGRWFVLEVAWLQSTIYVLPDQMNRCEARSSPAMSAHYTHCVSLLKHKTRSKCTCSQCWTGAWTSQRCSSRQYLWFLSTVVFLQLCTLMVKVHYFQFHRHSLSLSEAFQSLLYNQIEKLQ